MLSLMNAPRLVQHIVNKPWLCILLAAVLLAISIGLALHVQKNTTPYFMDRAHPERIKEDALSHVFSRSKETIVLVFASQQGDVFTRQGLELLTELHAVISEIDLIELLPDLEIRHSFLQADSDERLAIKKQLIETYNSDLLNKENALERRQLEQSLGQFIFPIRSVKSLLNTDDIVDTGDDIVVAPNFHDALLDDWKNGKGKDVLANPLLVKSLIDASGSALSVQLELTVDPDDSASTEAIYHKLEQAVTPLAKAQGFDVYFSGTPVVNVEISRIMEQDNERYFPLIILVIALLLFGLYRNVWAPILALSVSIISIALSMGFMTLAGISLNIVTTILPIFIITIGVTDAIHLLSKSQDDQAASLKSAIVQRVSTLFRAMLLTSVTTSLGFFSLSLTDIINIQEFGIMVGLSTLIAFVISVTVLPALMAVTKFHPKAEAKNIGLFLNVERWAKKQSDLRAMGIVLILLLVALFGAQQFYVDQQNLKSFDTDTKVRMDDQKINALFGGTVPVSIWISSDQQNGVLDSDTLAFIEQLDQAAQAHSNVGYTVSIASFLKRMHQVMFPDSSLQSASELESDLIAQYLFLLEGGASRDLETVLETGQYQQTRLVIMSNTDGSAELKSLIDDLQQISANPPPEVKVNYAGYGYLNVVAAQEIVFGQLNSIVLSVIGLVLLTSLIYRSGKTGLIVIFPLSVSLMMMFGLMGVFAIPLDIGTSLVCGIAFGIGIDYSIHIVEAYLRQARQLRAAADKTTADTNSTKTAIKFAMSEVCFPILTSAFTIAAGFSVLLISEFKPIFNLGLLVSSTMLISAFVTLFVLPSLLRFIPQKVLLRS